jgi:hypothetical protein
MKKVLSALMTAGALVTLAPGSLLAEKDEQPVGQTSIVFTDEGKPVHVFQLRPDASAPQALGQPVDLDGPEGDDENELNNGAPIKAAAGGNLTNHGGPTITSAKAVLLFWGNWSGTGSDVPGKMSSFFSQFGTAREYVTITQYSGIHTTALGGLLRTDTSTPPSTVSDSAAQAELTKNFNNGNLTADTSTVYFLYLPNGVKSTIGGSSSCTSYCGYHSNYTYSGKAIKYAVMPFPSCTGCQGNAVSGMSIYAASLTITSGHEMREAATDALGTAWYDRRGYEADDKCAWQLFIGSAGYQYQKEWSNSVSGCVQGGVTGP